jgi:hypothetical protein
LTTWIACSASGSWLIVTRLRLPRIASVCADIDRRSLPAISGDAITAHSAKCDRISVSVIPPRPTSSMSGSLNRPGPAYDASGTVTLTMFWMPIGYPLV